MIKIESKDWYTNNNNNIFELQIQDNIKIFSSFLYLQSSKYNPMKTPVLITVLILSLLISVKSRECSEALYSVLKPKANENREQLSDMIQQFEVPQITPSYLINNFKIIMELFAVKQCNTQINQMLQNYLISGRCLLLLKDLSGQLYKLSHYEDQNPFFYTLQLNKLQFIQFILKKNCLFMQFADRSIDFNKLISFKCMKQTIKYNDDQSWKNFNQGGLLQLKELAAVEDRLTYLQQCGLISEDMIWMENFIKGQCFKQLLTINKQMLLIRLQQDFTLEKLKQMLPQIDILKKKVLNACVAMNLKPQQSN